MEGGGTRDLRPLTHRSCSVSELVVLFFCGLTQRLGCLVVMTTASRRPACGLGHQSADIAHGDRRSQRLSALPAGTRSSRTVRQQPLNFQRTSRWWESIGACVDHDMHRVFARWEAATIWRVGGKWRHSHMDCALGIAHCWLCVGRRLSDMRRDGALGCSGRTGAWHAAA
jgi:hypothetical protein